MGRRKSSRYVWIVGLCVLAIAACSAPAGAPAPATPQASGAPTAVESADDGWQKIVAAAKNEGGLLVYTQAYTGNDAVAITREFQDKTGITADFISAAGDVLLQRYQSETKGGQPSADIIQGSPQFLIAGRAQGVFVPLKGKPLPIFREPASVWDAPPSFMGDAMDVMANLVGKTDGHITVNTSLLRPEDYPTSFHDLATNPKFIGKIGFNDPKVTGNVAAQFVKQGYLTDSISLHDLWSIYAVQHASTFARPGDQEAAVGRGEISVAIGAQSARLYDSVKAGAPIEILAFADVPVGGFPQILGVTAMAPHPNSALVFINWAFSKEGQTFLKQLQGTNDGPRNDVPSFVPEVLKSRVVGSGKKGPVIVASPLQAQLGSDLYASGVFQKLTDGIGAEDFESQATAWFKDWESKHGGPQNGTQGGALVIPGTGTST
jgi:iron(III) transport system substrate-binding protein